MYDQPLAYDIVFDLDTERECDFLETMHDRHARTVGRRLLEPGCGSGRLLRGMQRRGWTTDGFDASRPMLEFARAARENLDGTIIEARFDEFALDHRGAYALAHCLISSLQHVRSDDEALRHLRLVADHLAPGGLYVLGMHLADRPELLTAPETHHAERDGTAVTCVVEASMPELENRRQRISAKLHVMEDGRLESHRSSWWFRTWTLAQFRELLEAEPRLELAAIHDFGMDPGITYRLEDDLVDVIWILRRV